MACEPTDRDVHGAVCQHCGLAHLFNWFCKYDLHGEQGSFKSTCAACEEPIESGAPRAGDQYGNLYCDDSCMALGLSLLMERLELVA